MAAPQAGVRTFTVVWAGQFVSMVGSNLTGFALGVYIYRQTGSAVTLGFVFALNLLPLILVSPITGPLVDRWGPGRAVLVSNVGAMAVTLVLGLVLWTHTFALWQIYPIVAALSVLGGLEAPGFGALTPQLVPKDRLGQANGMRMVARAAGEVLAPVTAGFLLLAVHISGIVLIDVLSFSFAIGALVATGVWRARADGGNTGERDEAGEPDAASGQGGLLAEFREGWYYVASRRGLLALLLFLGAVNFSAGFIDLLITPLVLSFTSSSGLGAVLTTGGIGMILFSVAASARGGPHRRVRAVLGFSLLLTVASVLGAVRPNVVLVAASAFLFMGALGVIIAANQSVWQTKVEPHMLGRAMALVNMVASVPQLIAYAAAGLLADRVFQPLVGRDRVKSHALATLIGNGPGRGIALLIAVMSLLIAVSVAFAAANPRLRHLEDELPDVVDEDEAEASGEAGEKDEDEDTALAAPPEPVAMNPHSDIRLL